MLKSADVEFPAPLAGGGPAGVVEGLLPMENRPAALFEAGVVVPVADGTVLVEPTLPKRDPVVLPVLNVFPVVLNGPWGVPLVPALASELLFGVEKDENGCELLFPPAKLA